MSFSNYKNIFCKNVYGINVGNKQKCICLFSVDSFRYYFNRVFKLKLFILFHTALFITQNAESLIRRAAH